MLRFIDRNLQWILIGAGVVLLLAAIIQVFATMPPRKFTILTGPQDGSYYVTAEAYKKIAADKGFDLEIRTTTGPSETLQLLESGQAVAGFVQGGIAAAGDPTILSTLANVFYEPIWIFYRKDAFGQQPLARASEFIGKRIAVGSAGSGTDWMAMRLLEESAITPENTTLINMSFDEAAAQLASGQVDAGFFVASDMLPLPWRLLDNPDLDLISFDKADAYDFRLPWLTTVVLPEGGANIQRNIPAATKRLLATTANLLVRNDTHPDLVRLLVVAAVATHYQGGLFEGRFQFPNLLMTDLPINNQAQAYLQQLKNGDSYLDNHFPFWLAALFDRYLLFVLPVLLIALPLLARTQIAYRWYMQQKIVRWYKTVHAIDMHVDTMQLAAVDNEIHRLDTIDDKLRKQLTVSNSYMPQVYELRQHIEFVKQRLEARRNELLQPQAPTSAPTPTTA